ncbi:hypothetical protein K8R78_04125, partial [bacterium]|nr:hypothetical protein [bacterium]
AGDVLANVRMAAEPQFLFSEHLTSPVGWSFDPGLSPSVTGSDLTIKRIVKSFSRHEVGYPAP